jgi:hypothetical protein
MPWMVYAPFFSISNSQQGSAPLTHQFQPKNQWPISRRCGRPSFVRPIYRDWPVPKLPQARRDQGEDGSAGKNGKDRLLKGESKVKTVTCAPFKNRSKCVIPRATLHLVGCGVSSQKSNIDEGCQKKLFQFDRTSERWDTRHVCGVASVSAQTGQSPRQKREARAAPKCGQSLLSDSSGTSRSARHAAAPLGRCQQFTPPACRDMQQSWELERPS